MVKANRRRRRCRSRSRSHAVDAFGIDADGASHDAVLHHGAGLHAERERNIRK
jgi:hypothetical protein